MTASDDKDRPRRFYGQAVAGRTDEGWAVLLDGRTVRTPTGARLILPTEALAGLARRGMGRAGREHRAVASMAMTRLAFTAADQVAQRRAETAAEVGRYAGADLLCYFADGPGGLVERQARCWGPVLDWARDDLDLVFNRASGIIHTEQPPETIAKVNRLQALALDDERFEAWPTGRGSMDRKVLALVRCNAISWTVWRRSSCRGWTRSSRPNSGAWTPRRRRDGSLETEIRAAGSDGS